MHYGLIGWGREKWWTPEDLATLNESIKPYNVVLFVHGHGHEHAYRKYQWEGYDVVMAPAPQIDRDPKQPTIESKPRGFVVVCIRQNTLEVAHRTADGWREKWSKRISVGAATRQVKDVTTP